MLHLAKVQKQGPEGLAELRLLACQETEYAWAIMVEEVVISASSEALNLEQGLLVLLELSSTGEIESLQDATNWVLKLVQTYLTSGITVDFLQQEAERAEKWRQNLTLQNQELARRSLELEARREQIQALEESLIRDKDGDNN